MSYMEINTTNGYAGTSTSLRWEGSSGWETSENCFLAVLVNYYTRQPRKLELPGW